MSRRASSTDQPLRPAIPFATPLDGIIPSLLVLSLLRADRFTVILRLLWEAAMDEIFRFEGDRRRLRLFRVLTLGDLLKLTFATFRTTTTIVSAAIALHPLLLFALCSSKESPPSKTTRCRGRCNCSRSNRGRAINAETDRLIDYSNESSADAGWRGAEKPQPSMVIHFAPQFRGARRDVTPRVAVIRVVPAKSMPRRDESVAEPKDWVLEPASPTGFGERVRGDGGSAVDPRNRDSSTCAGNIR